MEYFASFMRQNLTKIIGYVTLAIGFLSVADPALIVSLFGERGRSWILVLAGILTAIRGHTNTAAIKDEIRVTEIAKEEIKVDKAVQKMQTGSSTPTGESP